MTRIRLLAACVFLVAPAACAAPAEDVGSSDEELYALATARYDSLSIERAQQDSMTLAYDCSTQRRELWRRMGDGAFRKVADIAPCATSTGRYVDRGLRPVRPYCYRMRTGRAWTSTLACGRTAYASCGSELRPWRPTSCPSGSDCVVRVQPGSCVDVVGSIKLDPNVTYDGVEFRIQRSNITLDCQGAKIFGPFDDGTGITVRSPWDVRLDDDHPIESCAELPAPENQCEFRNTADDSWGPTVDPVHDVTVSDCRVEGFRVGAKADLQSAWWESTRDTIIDEYLRWFRHPTEQQCRVGQIEDCMRRAAPTNVTFEGVHIRDSGSNGLHLRSYVNHVTFQNGSVHGAGQVGAYLTYGSRNNTIRDSTFRDNDREGIALDASAFNVISGNTLVGNSKRWLPEWEQPYGQAITIFRNAWESRYPTPTSAPRLQHAKGNVIERNEIRDHDEAIWIGFRQSTGRHSSEERGDPVYYQEDSSIPGVGLRYYRKNAEDTIVRYNTISDFTTGVVVDDDGAQVIGNWFADPRLEDDFPGASKAISIGNRIRRKAREPIHGARVNGNVFVAPFSKPIAVHDCAYSNAIGDNWVLDGGSWSRAPVSRATCGGRQALLTAHLLGTGGAVAESSFTQRGGFFYDDQRWLAGDVDADGLDDVISVQASDDHRIRIWLHVSAQDGFEHKSSFQTFEPPRWTFESGAIEARPAFPFALGTWLVGDFDGVRGDDLAYVYGYEETRVRLYTANGRGFQEQPDFRVLDHPYTDAESILGDSYQDARKWIAGDVNGDGDADIVVVRDDHGDAVVDVLRSRRDGRFGTPLSQSIGAWNDAHHWTLAQMDDSESAELVRIYAGSDGKAIAWAHRWRTVDWEHAWITYVSSDGTSSGAIAFDPVQDWIVADMNGDDWDDLVAITPESGRTRVFRARSNGRGLTYYGNTLLSRDHRSSLWLAGRFDCGDREDLVTVRGLGWGRVTDVDAPYGQMCALTPGPIVMSGSLFFGG